MKIRHCAALLIALLTVSLLAGCYTAAVEQTLKNAEKPVEPRLEAVEERAGAVLLPEEEVPLAAVPERAEPETVPVIPAVPEKNEAAKPLTVEQAKTIALDHAGFGPEEVRFLRAEYDFDDRIPQYDIEFDVGRWEYEYEIHAETGVILSFDKDD